MNRRARGADGQGAESGTRAPASHRGEAVVAGGGHHRDADVEHRERQLVLEIAAGEQRRPAETHVHHVDFQRAVNERVGLVPVPEATVLARSCCSCAAA